MQQEDRVIHLSTELVHRPGRHDTHVLQRLYFDLSQMRHAAYDSSDFSVPGQPRFYSRRGTETQSIAVFLPDRVLLVEEWADISLTDFHAKVTEVASRALGTLGIPAFVAQTATIRSTFALTHFMDARVFLLDHVCQQAGQILPYFGRPIAVGGLRFFLPATPDSPVALHVKVESFHRSPKEVFVEVKGVFGQEQITKDDLSKATGNIQRVRDFITDNVFPYVNQYDVVEEDKA
jgi:hypothetical protein